MQEPAKQPRPNADTSIVGQPQKSVLEGSRLAKMITKQGGDPGKGKTGPTKVELSDSRLAGIMQGKRRVMEFKWPGTDCICGIVVLTEEEIEEVAIWATDRLKAARKEMDSITYNERLVHENNIQLIWRSTVDPETRHPWALNPDELRRLADSDTMAYLVDIYNDWQQQTSPLTFPGLTEAEFNVIIEALKKNPETDLTLSLDAVSLRALAKSMAKLIPA